MPPVGRHNAIASGFILDDLKIEWVYRKLLVRAIQELPYQKDWIKSLPSRVCLFFYLKILYIRLL